MKLTKADYDDAKRMGFKPYRHKIDGFAEACFDTNSYRDLRLCRTATVDGGDCDAWRITPDEWRAAQVHAIELAMAYYAYYEDDQ